MINQYQVQAYLLNELPDIAIEFKKIYPSISVLKAVQCLSNYTRQVILQRDEKSLKKCFIVANNIYVNGTLVVRNAIETVFVRSLSLLATNFKIEKKQEMQSMMPLYLYSAYHQQTIGKAFFLTFPIIYSVIKTSIICLRSSLLSLVLSASGCSLNLFNSSIKFKL